MMIRVGVNAKSDLVVQTDSDSLACLTKEGKMYINKERIYCDTDVYIQRYILPYVSTKQEAEGVVYMITKHKCFNSVRELIKRYDLSNQFILAENHDLLADWYVNEIIRKGN